MNNLENLVYKNVTNSSFSLESNFIPTGDQPKAIEELITGIKNKEKDHITSMLIT